MQIRTLRDTFNAILENYDNNINPTPAKKALSLSTVKRIFSRGGAEGRQRSTRINSVVNSTRFTDAKDYLASVYLSVISVSDNSRLARQILDVIGTQLSMTRSRRHTVNLINGPGLAFTDIRHAQETDGNFYARIGDELPLERVSARLTA